MLSSTATAQGGPGPVDPRSSLALRQRILAEAALRLLGDQRAAGRPAARPASSPASGDSFFSGLDVPWLRLTTLDGATAVPPTPLDAARLRAPLAGRAAARPAPAPHRPTRCSTDGGTLQSVLTDNHVLREQLFEEVAGNASYAAQREPLLALAPDAGRPPDGCAATSTASVSPPRRR